MPQDPPPPTKLAWLAAGLILFAALPRTLAGWDPMPAWGISPLDPSWIPSLAFTPSWIIAMDAMGVLGLLLAIIGSPLTRNTVILAGLFAAGACSVLAHGSVMTDHAEAGTPWIAAVACALGASIVARNMVIRRVLFGVVLGAAVLMLAKSMWQVWVELPATRAAYKMDPDAYIRSQGWSHDSSQVRGYERRLAGSEASAWFGLSNVLATFMAAAWAAAVAMVAQMVVTRSPRPLSVVAGSTLMLVGSLGLWLSQSTAGALIGALVAVLAITAAILAPRLKLERPTVLRSCACVGPLLIAGVLIAIVIRGIIGTSIGELSVLFRWFYISTAIEIFGSHPLTGVGPAGFRDAYMLAKPAIAPEDVTSPHSLFFDWIGTLGIAGLAWGAMLVTAATRVGIRLVETNASATPNETDSIRMAPVLLLVVGCALPGLFLQRPMLTPGYAIVLLLGLGGWLGLTTVITQMRDALSERLVGIAAAAAGLAIILHTQFDVTGIWTTGAPLGGLLVGLAATRITPSRNQTQPLIPRRLRFGAIAVIVSVLLWLVAVPGVTIARWELALHSGAAPVLTIRETEDALAIAGHPATGPGARQRALDQVQSILRSDGIASPVGERAYGTWRASRLKIALDRLEDARQLRPGHVPTSRAYATLAMSMSEDLRRVGDVAGADAALERVRASGQALTDARPDHSGAWGWRGVVERELWQRTQDPEHLEQAIACRETAAALDPHGLTHPLALVDLYDLIQQPDARHRAAERVLGINEQLWLDPVVQLSPPQIQRLKGILGPRDEDDPSAAGDTTSESDASGP